MIISHSWLQDQFDNELPEELKRIPAWMGTRLETRPDGRVNKPPYRVRAGMPVIKAGKDKPKNRATFEEACAALERGDVDAIGFVFSDNDPFTAIDLDDVIDPETGEIAAWASEIVRDFPTYWEISLSGNGLHGISIGNKPGPLCGGKPIEIYDGRGAEDGECRASFIVLTGRATGPVREVSDCQEQINTLYHKTFPTPKRKRSAAISPTGRTSGGPPGERILDPEELLQKARNSRKGKQFIKLFDHGNRSGYSGNNEADMGLLNMLAFWCSGDPDFMEEMFRRSALFRPPPEKHRGYVAISVKKCLQSYRGAFYSRPKALRHKPEAKQQDVLAPYLTLLLDPSKWKGKKAASGYKAFTGLILLAVEDGIDTQAEELRIGADVRRLAERAGLRRETLGRSALPFLVKDLKLVTWKRGSGSRAGEFVIKRPDLPSTVTTKGSTRVENFSGDTYRDALNSLAQLVRMRSGRSKTGKINELGKFESVARLGMVAMFALVALTNAPRGLNIDELVVKTGRRKDNLRTTMQELVEAEIVEELRSDFFTLTAAFWSAYQRALIKSGIIAAERRQRRQHEREKREHARQLKEGKNRKKRASSPVDQHVIDMAAKRREREDREALRRQFMEQDDLSTLTPRQREERMQEVLMQEYDLMVERAMRRLEETARISGRDCPARRRTEHETPGESTREG